MIRRCNYDPDIVLYIHGLITQELLKRNIEGKVANKQWLAVDKDLARYVRLYDKTGMVDVVILNHLCETTVEALDTLHLRKLSKVLSEMRKYKPFPLVTVHDA